MITLKLGVYSEKEVNALATLLANNRYAIQHEASAPCPNSCSSCEYRHLCIDLAQAEMYAKDYNPKH